MKQSLGGLFYQDPAGEPPEIARYRYGQRIIWWGFFLIGLITISAIVRYDDPQKVTVVVSTVTGVVGTLIGAFFGVTAGSAGREQSEALTQRLLAGANPADAKAAMDASVKDQPSKSVSAP
jgi:hypothetical protein